jgi:glycosyltransferase involved in cell wall biosynthesis
MPRFSIIITCYNQENFIRDAVDSALAQTSADREIIVVDDGSADRSTTILENYGRAIKLRVNQANEGANAARNSGASLASGNFLVFLDGDDVLLPWALEVYDRIVDLKDPKLVLGKMVWVKTTSSLLHGGNSPHEISVVEYEGFMKKDRAYRPSASAAVVDRESFRNAGGWTPGIFPMSDLDFLMKLGYSGRTIQVISPQTTAYRIHDHNVIHDTERMIRGVTTLINREQLGKYPGGGDRRFERYAILGGVILYWFRRAFQEKFYLSGFRLLTTGWKMALSAILRRCIAIVQGRRPVETLTML